MIVPGDTGQLPISWMCEKYYILCVATIRHYKCKLIVCIPRDLLRNILDIVSKNAFSIWRHIKLLTRLSVALLVLLLPLLPFCHQMLLLTLAGTFHTFFLKPFKCDIFLIKTNWMKYHFILLVIFWPHFCNIHLFIATLAFFEFMSNVSEFSFEKVTII
jgi:hypothetical protein